MPLTVGTTPAPPPAPPILPPLYLLYITPPGVPCAPQARGLPQPQTRRQPKATPSPPACPLPATAAAQRALDPCAPSTGDTGDTGGISPPMGRRRSANTTRTALPGSCSCCASRAQPRQQLVRSDSSGSATLGRSPRGDRWGPEPPQASCSEGPGSPIRHKPLPTLPSEGGTQHCHGVTSQLPAAAVPPHKLWEATSEPSKPPSHAKPHPHPARAPHKCNAQHIPHWHRARTPPRPRSSGSWDEAPPEAPLPQNCSTGALPNPCRSCPLQAAGQAKFCRQLPESGESPITGVPQQSQKQQLGLRLGRREDKCLPAGEGDPAEGGGARDAGIRLRGGGPAVSSLPTAWPAARSSPAGHCSSQGVLTG